MSPWERIIQSRSPVDIYIIDTVGALPFRLTIRGNAKDTRRRVSKSTTPSLKTVPASLELSEKVYLE